MAIEFACPECARGYSVKDELAGKSAKCGQCGHKMIIPAASTIAPAVSKIVHAGAANPPAPKSAAAKSAVSKSAAVASTTSKLSAASSNAAKSVSGKPVAKPAAKAAAPKAPPADPDMSSWLDEELKSTPVQAKPQPQLAPSSHNCPSCEAPLAEGAVLCVKCGYDTRTRGRRSVQRVESGDGDAKPSKLAGAASLLRGSLFSFLGAMLGAFIWAVLAYLTQYEFSIVAWGLGGLAGLGMALGHDSADGTVAGIIAAFMSLVGIIAAKVFIVIIVIAMVINEAAHEMQQQLPLDPVEFQRGTLAEAIVIQELKAAGEDYDTASEERLEALYAKSEAEVAKLSAEEIDARLKEIVDQKPPDENLVDEDLAEDELAADDSVEEELSDDTADDNAPPPDEDALPEDEGVFGHSSACSSRRWMACSSCSPSSRPTKSAAVKWAIDRQLRAGRSFFGTRVTLQNAAGL